MIPTVPSPKTVMTSLLYITYTTYIRVMAKLVPIPADFGSEAGHIKPIITY